MSEAQVHAGSLRFCSHGKPRQLTLGAKQPPDTGLAAQASDVKSSHISAAGLSVYLVQLQTGAVGAFDGSSEGTSDGLSDGA